MANELINIVANDKGEPTVSGRDLHMFLEVETPYHKWFPRMAEYGFTENEDYSVTDKNVHNSNGGKQSIIDHMMTVDMAKEICMLQRTERGKMARQYFIQIEKDWNSPEKVMARALKIASAELDKVKAINFKQAAEIEAARPKVLFADAVSASHTSILIGELAKILRQNGINIGQNRLFAKLREEGYLIKSGSSKNMPTQRAMDMGLFEIKEGSYVDSNGVNKTTRTTKVTGKGQLYFINHFLAQGDEDDEE